jgi:hypothetical protein
MLDLNVARDAMRLQQAVADATEKLDLEPAQLLAFLPDEQRVGFRNADVASSISQQRFAYGCLIDRESDLLGQVRGRITKPPLQINLSNCSSLSRIVGSSAATIRTEAPSSAQ